MYDLELCKNLLETSQDIPGRSVCGMQRLDSVMSFSLDRPDQNGRRSKIFSFDGRLDNRDDLLMQLSDSLAFDTSNATLTLAAYERWGTDGFARLIGDWSTVIYDAVSRSIVLASDFAGVRPLYYCRQGAQVFWSSRLAALVEEIGITELDDKCVAGFLRFGGCPNRTPYKGIHSVPVGSSVSFSLQRSSIRQFWTLPTNNTIEYFDPVSYDEHFRALFREAVSVRVPENSTILAELSGGLDSSSVVLITNALRRDRGSNLATVSYMWPGSPDEPFIRDVESACDIDGFRIPLRDYPLVSKNQIGDAAPEPLAPVRARVAEIARASNARVFLTGQNGDLMTGNFFDDSLQVAGQVRRLRIGRACQDALAWSKILRLPIYTILWHAFRAALPSSLTPSDLFATPDGSYTPRNNETSISLEFSEKTGAFDRGRFFSTSWMEAPPERRKYFWSLATLLEMRTLQAPEALLHLDYTHPFAHRPLVEFMMNVPAEVLCGPGEPRKLMRRALVDLWTPKLRKRRSKGLFAEPWQEALRPLARQLLLRRELQVAERGFVDRASFRSRLTRICDGLECNQSQLQHVILLELWLEQRERGRNLFHC
jgi:asparagine synthase (glutamine-hydrolysing)